MCALRSVLLVLGIGLALLAPTSAATAAKAKPNQWAEYLWKSGTTCTYDTTYADGSTKVERTRAKRTKKTIKLRWVEAASLQTWTLASRGRMVSPDRSTKGATTIVIDETYPSVSQVRAKRGGAVMTLTRHVRYSAKEAKGFLISGRTMVVTARYRVVGLGQRTLTLPSGTVSAIGVGLRLRSISVSNVRKDEVARVKDFYRPEIKAGQGDEWWSKGRGVVLWTFGSVGARAHTTQRSCA